MKRQRNETLPDKVLQKKIGLSGKEIVVTPTKEDSKEIDKGKKINNEISTKKITNIFSRESPSISFKVEIKTIKEYLHCEATKFIQNLKAHKVSADKSNIFRVISKGLYDKEKCYKYIRLLLETYEKEDSILFKDFDIELLEPKVCKTIASSDLAEYLIKAFEIFTQVFRINFILISKILLFPKPSHLHEEFKHAILILYENYEFQLLSTENLPEIKKKNPGSKDVYELGNESIESFLDEKNQLIEMANEDNPNKSSNLDISLQGEENLNNRVIYKCIRSEIHSKEQIPTELSPPQVHNAMNLTYSLPQEQIDLLTNIGNSLKILITTLANPLQTDKENLLVSKTDCLLSLKSEILTNEKKRAL